MFLLTEHGDGYRLFLCEVKADSNNAWHAAVENLRQMLLLRSSPEPLRLFSKRCPTLLLPTDIPVTGLVLAPRRFYSSPGKKANSVVPALKLLERFSSEFALDLHLAVWNSALQAIEKYRS
jgi:hypothetical protein